MYNMIINQNTKIAQNLCLSMGMDSISTTFQWYFLDNQHWIRWGWLNGIWFK